VVLLPVQVVSCRVKTRVPCRVKAGVSCCGQGRGVVRVAQGGEVGGWRACAVTGLDLSVVGGGVA
jgi:hypothetical protein